MKVMKYFAAASLMLFAACNNEDNPTLETGNQPVDVIVSLNTIQVGTHAAMGGGCRIKWRTRLPPVWKRYMSI